MLKGAGHDVWWTIWLMAVMSMVPATLAMLRDRRTLD
jgi:hypothetical protein